jgi:hypothetical protein
MNRRDVLQFFPRFYMCQMDRHETTIANTTMKS